MAPREISLENCYWSVSRGAKPVTTVAIGEVDRGCFGRPPFARSGDCCCCYCLEIIE